MDDFDLYAYVEEVGRTLTHVEHDQSNEDVVFFDYFQPFQRPYSLSEVKDKYQIEAEKRGEFLNFEQSLNFNGCFNCPGIVPDLLEFENFFLPKSKIHISWILVIDV